MTYKFSQGMGNPTLVIIIAVVVIAGLLFFMSSQKGEEGEETVMEEGTKYSLVAMNDSGQDGWVTFEADGDKTIVTVDVTAGEVDIPQPVHIHAGTCDNLGGVDLPLTDLAAGTSVTVLEVPLADVLSGDRAVNVHKSAEEIGVYTSCGSISQSDVEMTEKDDAMIEEEDSMEKDDAVENKSE